MTSKDLNRRLFGRKKILENNSITMLVSNKMLFPVV